MKLELQATPEEVMRAVEELRAFGRSHGLDDQALFGLALALEECATNIVRHACGGRPQEKFSVGFERAAGMLAVELRDRGPAFDPNSAPARPAEDDVAGGWGIGLARRNVDEIRYLRDGGENVLRLVKRIQSG